MILLTSPVSVEVSSQRQWIPQRPMVAQPYRWVFKNLGEQKAYDKEVNDSETRVALPYKDLGVRYLWWQTEPDEQQFKMISETLSQIIADATSIGAEPILVVFPSPAAIYGKQLHKGFRQFYDAQQHCENVPK